MELPKPLILYLSITSLLLSLQTAATTTPSGTIRRTTKQQILAAITPDSTDGSEPFLTSPSGKYAAFLLRRETAPGAGGFGNDFCYVEVKEAGTGQSAWESECAPVSSANACSLVFSDAGLEVFDGSDSAWDTGADGDHPERLDLVDQGDMRITDKEGELVWKASEEPTANHGCGLPGSPGLAADSPPFAAPIGGGGNLPFGQAGQGTPPQHQVIPAAGLSQDQQAGVGLNQVEPSGFGGEPLVDNAPFDSGSARGVEEWSGVGLALLGFFGVGFFQIL